MALTYRIHPAIGVARLGNSPDQFYLGPESVDATFDPPQGGFKDPQCRLKRQGVRYYIYEYNDVTGDVAEVTDLIDSITWAFTPLNGKSVGGTRNFTGAQITGHLGFDAFSMTIHAGNATPVSVPLGDLRSDEQGRLIFLGGFGAAELVPGGGGSPPLTFMMESAWYDDVCEGPITAAFTFNGTPQLLHAWALSAPPRSQPQVPPANTLYDYLVKNASDNGQSVAPAVPGSPAALDKAQLSFVSTFGGDGIEVSLDSLTLAHFEPNDPLRLVSTSNTALLTTGLPNPWQVDIVFCDWSVWKGSWSDAEQARLNWSKQGLLVTVDGKQLVVEQCDAALSINLLTPTLDFGEVPRKPAAMNGNSLLAVVFEVVSTGSIELSYDMPPNGPFASDGPLPGVIGPTGGTTQTVRFWIRYTTTAASEDIETVVIRRVGSNDNWPVTLKARSVERHVTATALVLDRSGSMQDYAGNLQKFKLLQNASESFLNLALDGDFIQLVRYDDQAQAIPLLDDGDASGSAATLLSPSTRSTLAAHIKSDFLPAGSTSIGAGIHRGRERLKAVPADPMTGALPNKAMVILTDGQENTKPTVNTVAAEVDALTFAVGLGTPANTSAPVLQALANNRGGYLLITGDLTTGDNQFLLEKYFLQILAGINQAEVVLDPTGILLPRQQVAIPFQICDLDQGFEAILVSTFPQLVDFRIVSPAGRVLQPFQADGSAGASFALSTRTAYYRVALPAEFQQSLLEKAGTWYALLSLGRPQLEAPVSQSTGIRVSTLDGALIRERDAIRTNLDRPSRDASEGVPYSFLLHAYSSVALKASLHQDSYEPGARVTVRATLLDAGQRSLRDSKINVEILRPNETAPFGISLDEEPQEAGHFRGVFQTSGPGVYSLRIRARAVTDAGRELTRERALTAAVWYGGDKDLRDSTSDCCSGERDATTLSREAELARQALKGDA